MPFIALPYVDQTPSYMDHITPYTDLTTPYKVENSPAINGHHETGA